MDRSFQPVIIAPQDQEEIAARMAQMIQERQQAIEYLQQLDRQIAEARGAYNYLAQRFALAKQAAEPAEEMEENVD